MSPPDERPWLRFYGRVPSSLEYPATTLYEAVAATARRVCDLGPATVDAGGFREVGIEPQSESIGRPA